MTDTMRGTPCLPVYDDVVVAAKTLRAMIPQALPSVEGVEIAGLYCPVAGIGGSLYDVVRVSDDLTVFIVFEVAAVGVSAALMAAMAKVSFANHVRLCESPRSVVSRVNEELCACLSAPFFSTVFAGFLDLHDNRLTYCNAGSHAQLVYRAGGHCCEKLHPSGSLEGDPLREVFDEADVVLHQGDWVLLGTVGAGELLACADPSQGSSALANLLCRDASRVSPAEFFKEIAACMPGTAQGDCTMLAIAVHNRSRRFLLKEQLGFDAQDPAYLQHINYFEEMDTATAVVLRSMDNQGYADDTIRKMKITLTELLVNALDHGNNRDPSRKVIIGHMVDSRSTVVSVLDEGEGFDPARVPDPTRAENLVKDSGRGLFIVRCYVDKVSFNEKGNRVTITKYFD